MYIVISGIFLFTFGHMFKRLFPSLREYIDRKFGEKLGKGFVAIFLVSGFLLISFGYYHNEFDIYLYYSPPWLYAVTHLMMFCSLGLITLKEAPFGHASRLKKYFKHPMLTGLIVWSASHLLINGTLMAVILFGGLGVWGAIEIYLLEKNNSNAPEPEESQGTLIGDMSFLGRIILIYVILILIHIYLGGNVYPFL